MPQNLEDLKKWIGETEKDIDYVTVPAVHRLAATLDREDPMPKQGDPLPIGWHQIFFPRVVRHSQIGPDGHPARGDFLPPVPLPRRMFAGKRTTFHAPLLVGDEIRRESVIQSVAPKQGRTGQMVFVTVKTEIYSPRGLAITEEQDIVYREEPDPNAPPPPPQRAPGEPVWKRSVTPDSVMLFRYSALTGNGHRIHYDHPYVTGVEGYPGLVVHGPLQATLLAQHVLDHAPPGARLARFAYRGRRPCFDGRRLTLLATLTGQDARAETRDEDGATCMQAEAVLA